MAETERSDVDVTLADQVAIITGSSRGLGQQIAVDFARQGANLVLVSRVLSDCESQAVSLDSEYSNRRSIAVAADVLVEEQVERLVAEAINEFGRIDILVNSAGGTGPIETPAQYVPVEDFRSIMDLNTTGTFLPCKHVIPHMINREKGRIVNISGTSGLRGYRNRVGYSASKWAIRGLTRTLALELGPYGITVNAICPNVTHGSRMTTIVKEKAKKTNRTEEEVYNDFASQTALGRFVDDVDIAAAASYLVSEGARNVTGHDIIVDAGWDI